MQVGLLFFFVTLPLFFWQSSDISESFPVAFKRPVQTVWTLLCEECDQYRKEAEQKETKMSTYGPFVDFVQTLDKTKLKEEYTKLVSVLDDYELRAFVVCISDCVVVSLLSFPGFIGGWNGW